MSNLLGFNVNYLPANLADVVVLTVHFPFLNLDLSFFVFFFDDDDDDVCAPPSSADTEALPLADGFDESAPSSPDAEEEDHVVDVLDEGAAVVHVLAPLEVLEALPFPSVPEEAALELAISCWSGFAVERPREEAS